MNYASLLAHVPEGRHQSAVIDAALELAATFDAHTIGLHVYVPSTPTYLAYKGYPSMPGPDTLQKEEGAASERNAKLKTDFEARARRADVSKIEWRYDTRGFGETRIAEAVAQHARSADLVIMGQYDPTDTDSQVGYDTPAVAALHAARPILILPYVGHFNTIGKRVVLAWDASREATCAATAALPLLARAEAVEVVVVDEDKAMESGHGVEPGTDIALFLARHDVNVSVSRVPRDGLVVSEVLLSKVADNGADLLCMGAYGHGRLRELMLGGTTRDLMRHMTVPTLLAC